MLATGMCFIPAKQLGVRWQDLLKFIDVRQGRPSRWRTGRALPLGRCQGSRGSRSQRDWRAERGRAEAGGFLRDECVDPQSNRTAGKCEWMTSWPHTRRRFTPPYGTADFKSCRNGRIYEMNATATRTGGKLWISFKARLSELATCQLKNHSRSKLMLSKMIFSLAGLPSI